jgi:hypothetical protein
MVREVGGGDIGDGFSVDADYLRGNQRLAGEAEGRISIPFGPPAPPGMAS